MHGKKRTKAATMSGRKQFVTTMLTFKASFITWLISILARSVLMERHIM